MYLTNISKKKSEKSDNQNKHVLLNFITKIQNISQKYKQLCKNTPNLSFSPLSLSLSLSISSTPYQSHTASPTLQKYRSFLCCDCNKLNTSKNNIEIMKNSPPSASPLPPPSLTHLW